MTDFTPIASLAGGALIGLSAALMLVTHGRVAGVSGIFGGLLGRLTPDFPFRIAFVLGLVLAGVGALLIAPDMVPSGTRPSLLVAAVAGLVVGFGTRLGNGCTSGHGICGVSRWSTRSIVATATFIATGAITVFIVRHVVGGGS